MSSESDDTERAHCPHCGEPLGEADPEDDAPGGGPAPKFLRDPAVREAVINNIIAGNTLTDAAADAGVPRTSLHRWLALGRDQRARKKTGPYRRFLEECETAERQCVARLVNIVAAGVEDDPSLALSVLERKDPVNWAPRVAVMVQEDRDKVLDAVFREFESEPQIVERFLAAVAGVDVPPEVRRVQEAKVINALPERGDAT